MNGGQSPVNYGQGQEKCTFLTTDPLFTDQLLLQTLRGQEADQVDDAVGVAPLVVVPAQHLHAVADDLGQRRVHDRGERVALEVGADQQVLVVAQNALQLAFAGGLERGVHGLDVGRLLADEGQVDDGDVRRGNADREAVQLAGGLGNHQLQRLGGAGRAGNHVQRGSAGAAQVLVREVEDDLVVGVAVNGGHDAGDDAAWFR